ncbi:unnamed protein product [Caenorhabditis auriculariae]|uniref:Uncharacterized protein n=1 Tax=Caenorhabditis auriculariae TaxID=2777116 RepID=A0A8S1HSI8_9PELO|nr:unnamed protein product [Caenorhabditis auriculariae]
MSGFNIREICPELFEPARPHAVRRRNSREAPIDYTTTPAALRHPELAELAAMCCSESMTSTSSTSSTVNPDSSLDSSTLNASLGAASTSSHDESFGSATSRKSSSSEGYSKKGSRKPPLLYEFDKLCALAFLNVEGKTSSLTVTQITKWIKLSFPFFSKDSNVPTEVAKAMLKSDAFVFTNKEVGCESEWTLLLSDPAVASWARAIKVPSEYHFLFPGLIDLEPDVDEQPSPDQQRVTSTDIAVCHPPATKKPKITVTTPWNQTSTPSPSAWHPPTHQHFVLPQMASHFNSRPTSPLPPMQPFHMILPHPQPNQPPNHHHAYQAYLPPILMAPPQPMHPSTYHMFLFQQHLAQAQAQSQVQKMKLVPPTAKSVSPQALLAPKPPAPTKHRARPHSVQAKKRQKGSFSEFIEKYSY